MLYLEDSKGNLIREFNLKNQLEEVRHYFNKANATKNYVKNLEKQYKELKEKVSIIDKFIHPHSKSREDVYYTVNGEIYPCYAQAREAAIDFLGKPELRELVKQYDKIASHQLTKAEEQYATKYDQWTHRLMI